MNKFTVYLLIDYVLNKLCKGKREEFIKLTGKLLTSKVEFMVSKRFSETLQFSPMELSFLSNNYEIVALFCDFGFPY